MSLKGIDISNWQSNINLSAIKADFIIVKSSEGIGWTDPSFKKLFKAAKATGKKLGVYHFARPTANNDPVKEADSFLNIIKPEGVIGNAILVLDWEAENKHNTQWAKKWLDRVYKQTGVKPMIYMSESVTRSYDWKEVADAGYELWVAKYRDYAIDKNYDMSKAGTIPSVRYWKKYTMWQWTSSGRLDGFSGNLDCNEFYGTTADWDKLAGKSSSKTPEGEKNVANSYKPSKNITPQEWYNMTYGKSYDVDGAYGAQCWDYFAYFVKYLGLGVNTYCAKTGYVGDLWQLKDQYKYSQHFEYITDRTKFKNGDWIIWPRGSKACPLSHIAMYWNGQSLGQNQGGLKKVTLKSIDLSQAYGVLRWKAWSNGTSQQIDLSKYTDAQLADMVLQGKFGTGEARKAALGSRYSAVQKIVNEKVSGGASKPATNKKSNEEIAKEVLAGKWGNGPDRKKKLEAVGYDYAAIQTIVNKLASGKTLKVGAKIKIKSGAKDLNTGKKYLSFVYKTTYVVKSISGNRVVFATTGGIVIGVVSKDNIILQ